MGLMVPEVRGRYPNGGDVLFPGKGHNRLRGQAFGAAAVAG